MVPHRDRLVILSFTTSPHQNNSIQDEHYYKTHRRPSPPDDDNEHLIEKVHPMSFDDNEYSFETHEKLMESDRAPATTFAPITSTIKEAHDANKVFPTTTYYQQPTEPIFVDSPSGSGPYVGANGNGNGRRQNGKMRNRTNSTPNTGRPGGRKASASNKNKNAAARRGDDGEFGKSAPKKYPKADVSDELQPDNEFESSTNRKGSTGGRDSNIHIVKPVDGPYIPSTPYSTDSKIIEIKPSTSMRSAKRNKRSAGGPIETRMRIETDGADDEFGDASDEVLREPRIYVNLDSDEHYSESEEQAIRPTMMSDAHAAALIDAVPVNVTAASKQLDGLAACLQHYLNADREIGN